MSNRESVITHLQIIHTWAKFACECDLQFFTSKRLLEDIARWIDDTLKLLEKQREEFYHMRNMLCDTQNELEQRVVRCKDCKHGRVYDVNCVACEYQELSKDLYWYCADGERKSADEKLMEEMDADPLG